MSDRVMITFVGDTETKRKLEQLATETERSQSAFLRWVIGREYDSLRARKSAIVQFHTPPPDGK